MIMRWCNVQTNEYDLQAKTYPTICTHHKLHNNNKNKFPVFPECMLLLQHSDAIENNSIGNNAAIPLAEK